MKSTTSKLELNRRIKKLGGLDALRAASAAAMIFEFYRDVRAVDATGEEGDMLMIDWALRRSGRFELSFTRQFAVLADGFDRITQLELRLAYGAAIGKLAKPGSRMCNDVTEVPEEQRGFMRSAVLRHLATRRPLAVTLGYIDA